MVGVHVRVGPQGARDDGARGVRTGLVGRDLPGVDELLDVGVVVRHAHERAVAQQVDARVAHVRDGHAALLYKAAGGGAAHAGLAGAFLGAADDGGVGGLDRRAKKHVVGRGRGLVGDGLDRDGARHLAGGVPAHAVAHGKEGRAHEEGVLVVATDQAHVGAGAPRDDSVGPLHDVGAGAALDGHLRATRRVGRLGGGGVVQLLGAHPRLTRMMVSPTWTSSPSRSVTAWTMVWPLTSVPLVEPMSSRTSAGPCRLKRACIDET